MKIKNSIREILYKIKNTALPPALLQLKTKQLVVAIALALLCIIAAITLKNASCLIGLFFSTYMSFKAFKLDYDYANGKIIETELTCISVQEHKISINSMLNIIFCDDEGNTYKYRYENKKGIFYENLRYRLYTHETNKNYIIAYEQI